MPIYRGTYYSKALQFKNRSDGQPIDISLWEFEATLKDAAGAELLAMSTGDGHFTVTDGPNGWLLWALTVAQTEAISTGQVTFAAYRTEAAEGLRRLFRAEDVVRERD